MMSWMETLSKPPEFEDSEKTRLAYILHYVLWGSFVLGGAGFLALLIGVISWGSGVLIMGAIGLLLVGLFIALRRGYVFLVAYVFVAGVWSLVIGTTFYAGGLSAGPNLLALVLVIFLAGSVLGEIAALVVTVLSIFSISAILWMSLNYILPAPSILQFSSFGAWWVYSLLLLVAGGAVYVFTRTSRRVYNQVNLQKVTLAECDRELEMARATFDERLSEGLADLEQRHQYLEAGARVAYVLGSIFDLDILPREVVNLIRSEFSLHYVGLFLVDSAQEWAVMRAGAGSAGQALLASKHRVKIGEGAIGEAILNRKSHFVQPAQINADRPLLPELSKIRSEVVLPLRLPDQVIGALILSSSESEFFDESVLPVLQTMADLVTLALHNARLSSESKQALDAAANVYSEMSHTAWKQLLQMRSGWGYHFYRKTITPVSGDWKPEMIQAAKRKQKVHREDKDAFSLALPIQVRGEVIGVLNFRRKKASGAWSEGDISLLTSLADQLSQALDNARLLGDVRESAQRERLISDVTGRMRQTLDIDAILRTATQEFQQIFSLSDVEIRMGEAPFGSVFGEDKS